MRERIMNVMKKKEDNKGFTLVELIVVIVILAILAALLIPGLLKWIDKAKQEQYTLEARNIYLATEAEVAQLYAAGKTAADVKTAIEAGGGSASKIATLSDVTDATITADSVQFRTGGSETQGYEIIAMEVTFKSADNKKVTMQLTNKSWNFVKAEASGT